MDLTSIEEVKSWKLYQGRSAEKQAERRLHYYTEDERPDIQHSTQHALMIDAGSQGTRIHVYEFEARVLSSRKQIKHAVTGKKLSFPTTDTRWTNRIKPGLDSFAFVQDEQEMRDQIRFYLSPLLKFARDVLSEKQSDWSKYPIYLKATGGLRALPRTYRRHLVDAVRSLFRDTSFNPFYFQDEHARVISGEEEAIYGWTAINFAKNALIANSEGTGSVLSPNLTYGVLEMGGASSQIAFFEPGGDVMANLFKLQIGAAKHWNVYAHSFLYFGVNLAFDRLNARLYTETTLALQDSNNNTYSPVGVYNPCLPGRSRYIFTSRIHLLPNGTLLPLSSPNNQDILEADMYSVVIQNDGASGDYEKCAVAVKLMLRKEANQWCNFAHDWDCSLAGIYQPPLPINIDGFGEFIATSNFYDVFQFLGLGHSAPVRLIQERATNICSMSLFQLQVYGSGLDNRVSDINELIQYCFRATFVGSLLSDGFGFPLDYNISSYDVIDGQKLGWALGSTLYEINTLPWEFEGSLLKRVARKHPSKLMMNIFSPSFEINGSLNFFNHKTAILTVLVVGVIFTVKSIWRRQRGSTRQNVLALQDGIGTETRHTYGAVSA